MARNTLMMRNSRIREVRSPSTHANEVRPRRGQSAMTSGSQPTREVGGNTEAYGAASCTFSGAITSWPDRGNARCTQS